MIDQRWIDAHRNRSLSPDRPVLRGSAQNPDVFFQAREAINPYYLALPGIVQQAMDRFAGLVGRSVPPLRLCRCAGCPASRRRHRLGGRRDRGGRRGTLTARGEKVGAVKVRLFRPFDASAFVAALPPTTRAIAVLDRTKEPGALGEPLYQDVVTALAEAWAARGRRRGPLAARDRRAIRARLQGVHARDGRGCLRRARARRNPAVTSPSGSSTTSRT